MKDNINGQNLAAQGRIIFLKNNVIGQGKADENLNRSRLVPYWPFVIFLCILPNSAAI